MAIRNIVMKIKNKFDICYDFLKVLTCLAAMLQVLKNHNILNTKGVWPVFFKRLNTGTVHLNLVTIEAENSTNGWS